MKLDLQAAEALLRTHRPKLVDADRIIPQWIDDGAHFGYQVTRDGEDETYLVDPSARTRTAVAALPKPPGTGDFCSASSVSRTYRRLSPGPRTQPGS